MIHHGNLTVTNHGSQTTQMRNLWRMVMFLPPAKKNQNHPNPEAPLKALNERNYHDPQLPNDLNLLDTLTGLSDHHPLRVVPKLDDNMPKKE